MNLSVIPEIQIESDQFETNVDAKGEDKNKDKDELFSKNVEASLELGSGKSASENAAEDEDYPQQINNNDTSIVEMIQDLLAIETDTNGTVGEGQ